MKEVEASRGQGDSMEAARSRAFFVIASIAVLCGGFRVAAGQTPTQRAETHAKAATAKVGVGPQYDATHVYVAPEEFDRFVASVVATFGGTTSKQAVTTVTPTASS